MRSIERKAATRSFFSHTPERAKIHIACFWAPPTITKTPKACRAIESRVGLMAEENDHLTRPRVVQTFRAPPNPQGEQLIKLRTPSNPKRERLVKLRAPLNPKREHLVNLRAPRDRFDWTLVSLDVLLAPVRERLTPGLQALDPVRAFLAMFRAGPNLLEHRLLSLDVVRHLVEKGGDPRVAALTKRGETLPLFRRLRLNRVEGLVSIETGWPKVVRSCQKLRGPWANPREVPLEFDESLPNSAEPLPPVRRRRANLLQCLTDRAGEAVKVLRPGPTERSVTNALRVGCLRPGGQEIISGWQKVRPSVPRLRLTPRGSRASPGSYPSTPEQMGTRLADVLATAGHRVLVAQGPDSAIVGWLHLGCLKWLEGDPRAEIGGLVVDEAHRGQKIGESLVEAAVRWAEGEGYSEIRVRSNVVRTDAHRFYGRLGFARVKAQQVFRRPLDR